MSRLSVLIPVAAVVVLAGCTGIPVRTDQNSQLLASVHCQSVAWAGGFRGKNKDDRQCEQTCRRDERHRGADTKRFHQRWKGRRPYDAAEQSATNSFAS